MGTWIVNHEGGRDCPCGCEGRVTVSIGCGCPGQDPDCDHVPEKYSFSRDEWETGGEWFIAQVKRSHREAVELRDLAAWAARDWQAEVDQIQKISDLILRERESAATDHRLDVVLTELLRQLLCLRGGIAWLDEDGEVVVETDEEDAD